ncbi:MAG: flavodoxin-dependent (E)-4-hydroxy-3-methylbut-2-enyl-diphosphate synthase [Spirochaetes bacterium]|jgi:(E)-4-hydroxy-3-methylbut-2-enyl-diphosphate synthase|nr:flavodoxin-dependent (E)-4-hydroxy-3-methylbut-2-enyl-diphosphate synthase [Spirochaetota bacterium]
MINKAPERKKTRQVNVGGVLVGGDAPVSIQSMTSLPIEKVDATLDQIESLRNAGAEIVRLAIINEESVSFLKKIAESTDVPIAADVHFNYRIAIEAIKAGVSKIRINPGNIGGESRLREVVAAARDRGVPIRIGVNAGSLDRNRYGPPTSESLVASALDHVGILEDNNFSDIVVSIKSSDIRNTIDANRIFSLKSDYPLHVGLTEAGFGIACAVNSSVAIGHLLLDGIGDTVRVSMTGDPVEEVVIAKKILEAAGLRRPPVRIISCPTCGRTDPEFDVLDLAVRAEKAFTERYAADLQKAGKTLTIAVMGCEVNGPGEASEADIGIAGAHGGKALLFSSGRRIRKIDINQALKSLLDEAVHVVRDMLD